MLYGDVFFPRRMSQATGGGGGPVVARLQRHGLTRYAETLIIGALTWLSQL